MTTIQAIQQVVAVAFKVPIGEMLSDRRARKVARPRQVAMYLSRELTPFSLPKIGQHFGNRDHTTVMSAITRVNGLMASDADFKTIVEEMRGIIVLRDRPSSTAAVDCPIPFAVSPDDFLTFFDVWIGPHPRDPLDPHDFCLSTGCESHEVRLIKESAASDYGVIAEQ